MQDCFQLLLGLVEMLGVHVKAVLGLVRFHGQTIVCGQFLPFLSLDKGCRIIHILYLDVHASVYDLVKSAKICFKLLKFNNFC